jgi:hypothetical protein
MLLLPAPWHGIAIFALASLGCKHVVLTNGPSIVLARSDWNLGRNVARIIDPLVPPIIAGARPQLPVTNQQRLLGCIIAPCCVRHRMIPSAEEEGDGSIYRVSYVDYVVHQRRDSAGAAVFHDPEDERYISGTR